MPKDLVDEVWHITGPMIERALRYTGGRFRMEDVRKDIDDMTQTLWIAIKNGKIIGCCTVSICDYPSGERSIVYEYLAGANVEEWLPEGHRVLSRYGKDNQCTLLECQGRSGWKPFLEKLGWRQFSVKYEFRLED